MPNRLFSMSTSDVRMRQRRRDNRIQAHPHMRVKGFFD